MPSDAAQLQIIEASRAPVVGSHHGLRHFNDVSRNMSDDVLRELAARGGLMGVHSMASFLSPAFVEWSRLNRPRGQVAPLTVIRRSADQDDEAYISALDARMRAEWLADFSRPLEDVSPDVPLPTVSDWAEHVRYAVSVAGTDHVGIGTDMLSGHLFGRGAPNLRDFDVTQYPLLTEAMLAKGLPTAVVEKVLGANWLRVFDAVTSTANEMQTARE